MNDSQPRSPRHAPTWPSSPPEVVGPESARPQVVGIDVGGTKTLAVVYDGSGDAVAEVQRPTPALGGEVLVAFLVDLLRDVATEAGVSAGDLAAVGLGLPGLVDPEAGTLRHAVNLGIGDDPVQVAGPLARMIGGPVRVANDVNLAAAGAAELLGLRGDVAYLSIGTGLALGLVLDGKVHHGATGTAGEIGHLPIDPYGPLCECGQRGCLEMVVSGRAIARRWPVENGSVGGAGTTGSTSEGTGIPLQPATALLRAAAAGDLRAVAVRDDVCEQLAATVSLVAQTVDPDVIVLGGGVVEAGDLLLAGLRQALDRRAARSPLVATLDLAGRVLVLPPGQQAGAVGAASVARALVPERR